MKDSVDARASRVSDPTVQVSTQITAFFVLEGIPTAGRSPSGISGGMVSMSFSIFSASTPKSRVLRRFRFGFHFIRSASHSQHASSPCMSLQESQDAMANLWRECRSILIGGLIKENQGRQQGIAG